MDWERFDRFLTNYIRSNPVDCDKEPYPFLVSISTPDTANKIARIISELDREIHTVYDLGAGDFRLSKSLSDRGYHVVGYEINKDLVEDARSQLPLEDIKIRCRNYHEDWSAIGDEYNACYVVVGVSNLNPPMPSEGVLITSEDGSDLNVYVDGQ